MKLIPPDYESKLRSAVAQYWTTLARQSAKQQGKDADRGRRAAVTGGKQMDGFCEMLRWWLNQAVGVAEPHFKVFPEFRDASYSKRYRLLLRKLMLEKLYDGAAFLVSSETAGPKGIYSEPSPDLTMKKFLNGLASRTMTFIDVK